MTQADRKTHKYNNFTPEVAEKLQRSIAGVVQTDIITRTLYSTDASIYQIEPMGVIFPKNLDDLPAIVEIAHQYSVPVLARGSGSSLAGQAVGNAWIVDCSRYLNHLVEINPDEKTAVVEPGYILNALNQRASRYRLRFGPDPASAERATLGGSIANNAAGANSILYGMAADHILSAEVVLADGSLAAFESIELGEAFKRAGIGNAGHWQVNYADRIIESSEWEQAKAKTIEADFYRAAISIRKQAADAIMNNWPKTWRRASGYNLNYLLPWSPSSPPTWFLGDEPYPPVQSGHINLAPLLAGSEGTLAVFRRLTLRLVDKQKHTVLFLLAYPSIAAACDEVSGLLLHKPSAIELIPRNLILLAKRVPAYAQKMAFLDHLATPKRNSSLSSESVPAALLVIEFSGDDLNHLRHRVTLIGKQGYVAETPESQKDIWNMRKAGLGLLMSRTDDVKPLAFIEDLSVPVEHLGEFVREMEHILANHEADGDFYAHASAGCLHLRPLINLKSAQGMPVMRLIAEEAVKLVLRLGGSVSGEHGDGLARSEWLEQAFGQDLLGAFRLLKNAADPKGILNPGKIIDHQPMDTNLRIQTMSCELKLEDAFIRTQFDYSSQGGFLNAVEQCNGAGVCRKHDGVMCPSFQATQDEMHSTRGRANLLRAMLYGQLPFKPQTEKALYNAFSLCLACKGCKGECPSRVDMAKLKYEFIHRYYSRTGLSTRVRPVRDYLFAYIGLWSGLVYRFAPMVNAFLGSQLFGFIASKGLGLTPERAFPMIRSTPLRRMVAEHEQSQRSFKTGCSPKNGAFGCILLSDPFLEYFQPEVGLAAYKALASAGYQVKLLPVIGAGRTYISKGFLKAAHSHAKRVIEAVRRLDPQGRLPIVGVEPSELYTLRDEYLDLLPNDDEVKALSKRSFLIDEFLVRPAADGKEGTLRIVDILNKVPPEKVPEKPRVILHGHCYQKVQLPDEDGYPNGSEATKKMLEMAGYSVTVIEAGCCGMAGAFGYEREHYHTSMEVGEISLFPAVREALALGENIIIAAPGFSCQSQIKDGIHAEVVHPIMLV